eukprot:3101913-Rhodomonas_salina.1
MLLNRGGTRGGHGCCSMARLQRPQAGRAASSLRRRAASTGKGGRDGGKGAGGWTIWTKGRAELQESSLRA